jgi:hypothetical protein
MQSERTEDLEDLRTDAHEMFCDAYRGAGLGDHLIRILERVIAMAEGPPERIEEIKGLIEDMRARNTAFREEIAKDRDRITRDLHCLALGCNVSPFSVIEGDKH